MFSLEGKAALITGANRGLGQAMAIALAAAGASIIGLSREDAAEETRAGVEACGRAYHHLGIDLAVLEAAGCAEVIAQAVGAYGRLDILVNNAGIIRRAPAIDVAEADWQAVIHLNLTIVMFLAQAAARHMRSHGGGRIINLASMLSYQGGINVPAYTASKHGIMGLTRALANEWAANGINVNAIAPGYMATDNTQPLRDDPARSAAILNRIPAGRWGEGRDLSGAIVFLASRASDYVHGATLDVDGGWLGR